MTVYFAEIEKFAEEQFEKASRGSKAIRFALSKTAKSRTEFLVERYGSVTASALVDDPSYVEIETGFGKSIWAVVLAVDLRRSSMREIRIGPKNTHLTMHTYLPTMVNLVGQCNGVVVGLRGDGLIAQFGGTEITKGDNTDVSPQIASEAAKFAVRCGRLMVETVRDIINPLLERNGIESNLAVGVGIDQGALVVTRIGYLSANELTAYGPAVNNACKYSDQSNELHVTTKVRAIYPSGEGGKVRFRPASGRNEGLIVQFPRDWQMLKRERINKPR